MYHEQYSGKILPNDPFEDIKYHGRALRGWRKRGRDVRVVPTNARMIYMPPGSTKYS